MSDSKKRSRKSKILMRNYFDVEEVKTTILQTIQQLPLKFPTSPPPLRYLTPPQRPTSSQQHPTPPLQRPTSSQQHPIPTQERPISSQQHPIPPQQRPTSSQQHPIPPQQSPTSQHPPLNYFTPPARAHDHTYARVTLPASSSSGLQLSVKVEVEEFDEPIVEESTQQSMPKHVDLKMIYIFQVDLEKVYKTADHISQSSRNPADKYLSMELKNIWGWALKGQATSHDPIDPYSVKIQSAISTWAFTIMHEGLKSYRESPLFYQCHLCRLAWWYLTPFKEHIKTHDIDQLKVYHVDNNHESIIVASDTITESMIYIPCEGNCYRCGNPYNSHIWPYSCKMCQKPMETCSMIPKHNLECAQNQSLHPPKNHKCSLCFTSFVADHELDFHMITNHKVRSDIPVPCSFKTCNVCQNRYHHYFAHMCTKSTFSSPCMYCYRKFQTKMLREVHYETGVEDYQCQICDEKLQAQCMETEHMLNHTDKFRMVYRCTNHSCPPTMVFPDECSIRWHRLLYHKLKRDRRRASFEKVLLPKQYVEYSNVQVLPKTGEKNEIKIMKIVHTEQETEEISDWCIPDAPDGQTDEQTNEDDDVIIIKQELEEMETIELDSMDEAQEEIQDDSLDCSYGQMDYAEMLSKVFKVSEAGVQRSSENIETQIKIEPSDADYEEDLITIKQEPIEACLGSFADICQIDTCQSQKASRQSSGGPSGIRQNDTDINTDGEIKVEPLDYEMDAVFDTDITAVKLEPEDVKQEIFDGTEVDEYAGDNVIAAEEVLAPETVKNPKSLLKNSKEKGEKPPESKSLLKQNFANDKTKSVRSKSKKRKLKSDSKKTKTDSKNASEDKKKNPKYNDDGVKTQKMYRCAKCGYTQNHKLYRIHQSSYCELKPVEDRANAKCYKFLCTKCDTYFNSLKSYLVHFTRHGYSLLHCPCCNVKFEMIKELMPHFHKHIKQNYVNCWMINDAMETTKKQHRCQTCRQIVRSDEFFPHWETHLKLKVEHAEPKAVEITKPAEHVHHTKELPPTTLHLALHQLRALLREKDCLVCQRKFGRRYDVKRHIIEHLLLDAYTKKDHTPTSMLRCQICLEEFPRREQYKFHMREHGGLPVYRCTLCDKTFSDSSNFAKHKKIHNMRVLICDICQKKFHAKSSLEKHMMIHMTTDPIKCDHCDKVFYSTSQYNKHQNVKHIRLSKFRCIVCDLSFDSLRKKWDHCWLVHKERKHKADCPICHVSFRKYQDVKNHAKAEHNLELSFYNIKTESGVVKNVKVFCHFNKNPKETWLLSEPTDITDITDATDITDLTD